MNLTQSGDLCVVSTSNIQCVTKQSVAIVAAAFFDPKLFTETFKTTFSIHEKIPFWVMLDRLSVK